MPPLDDGRLEAYDFDLPRELVAMRPLPVRSASRLLVYDQESGAVVHARFIDLADHLPKDSLLVLNDSRVVPARIVGSKASGGRAEVLVLGPDGASRTACRALLGTGGGGAPGAVLGFPGGARATVVAREGTRARLEFDRPVDAVLRSSGRAPIPPYIRGGESDARDARDYQTVFARRDGSVAAPTAGLHFDDAVFGRLARRGVGTAFVTLHVGPGTFEPVRAGDLARHRMSPEEFDVGEAERRRIREARGGVFAVGTTTLRALETVARGGPAPGRPRRTDLFLRPGEDVRSIDGLVTNLHPPRSTPLMLVACLVGREKALELYSLAVGERYRFLSYGDAMLILRRRRRRLGACSGSATPPGARGPAS